MMELNIKEQIQRRVNHYVSFDDLLYLLYESEINIEISSFWDGGWSYRLGDFMNGFTSDNMCNSIGSGAGYERPVDMYEHIVMDVIELYPTSKFTKDIAKWAKRNV